ncbi:hypothetical protein [Lactiplantibacillus plantarum]|uniref:hypothetical protein n=1 Tax=Lactiplantibacillus plantarum TaxID=1590 RepID=UPI002D79F34E|nr:hypothetical protein [Lactiplantibacillus plantarum]
MKLKIENNDLTVTVEATRELSFEEIFKSHQLVTGRNDELNTGREEKHTFVPEDAGETTEDSNNEPKFNFKKPTWMPKDGEMVKAEFMCPQCGYDKVTHVKFGYNRWSCPGCGIRLFLAYATGTRGEKDANGFYYKANREFISHAPENSDDDFSKMFTRSDDPEKPDAYDTIPDIKKYLDKHGIDYSHAKFKGDYVALIPDD